MLGDLEIKGSDLADVIRIIFAAKAEHPSPSVVL